MTRELFFLLTKMKIDSIAKDFILNSAATYSIKMCQPKADWTEPKLAKLRRVASYMTNADTVVFQPTPLQTV